MCQVNKHPFQKVPLAAYFRNRLGIHNLQRYQVSKRPLLKQPEHIIYAAEYNDSQVVQLPVAVNPGQRGCQCRLYVSARALGCWQVLKSRLLYLH